MTTLQQVIAGAGAAIVVNENLEACSPAALFGINLQTTSGLILGIYGGQFNNTTVNNVSLSLAANNLNYVVVNRSTGVISSAINSTNWFNTSQFLRLYSINSTASTLDIQPNSDVRQVYGLSPVPFPRPWNFRSSGYTLADSDAENSVSMNGAFSVTVPPNSSVPFAIGASIILLQEAAGAITITAGAGVTLRLIAGKTLVTAGINSIVTLRKLATDSWIVTGDLL